MSTMREDSKREWTSNGVVEHINIGSLQRIADATELMSKRYAELIRERDQFERWYKEATNRADRIGRRLSAAKGQITKLRNAAKEVKSHDH